MIFKNKGNSARTAFFRNLSRLLGLKKTIYMYLRVRSLEHQLLSYD
jgi:hypothetical protein